MFKIFPFTIALPLLVISLAVGSEPSHQSDCWEYKTLFFYPYTNSTDAYYSYDVTARMPKLRGKKRKGIIRIDNILNDLGKEGWELCNATSTCVGLKTHEILYFKRRCADQSLDNTIFKDNDGNSVLGQE